jgi:Na+/proline symporter
LFAFNNNESIFALVRYAWCGLGSTFGPIIILSLHSKKVTGSGALAGIIIGGITAGIWRYIGFPIPILNEYPIIPGFILSFISIVFVSRLRK